MWHSIVQHVSVPFSIFHRSHTKDKCKVLTGDFSLRRVGSIVGSSLKHLVPRWSQLNRPNPSVNFITILISILLVLIFYCTLFIISTVWLNSLINMFYQRFFPRLNHIFQENLDNLEFLIVRQSHIPEHARLTRAYCMLLNVW